MMKTTLNWLKDYCACDLSAEDLAEALSMSGLLIEELEPLDDDCLLVAEVTTNRPDQLGIIGMAREASALTGVPLNLPPVEICCTDEAVESAASIEVPDADLCPRYTARLIRGVKISPSPDWLKKRLESIGVRSVNNVVDVTNYVLFECGQPLHAFDFDKLGQGKIIVRRAVEGEIMISIDETKCKLDPSMLVIADATRPVAIAGIMGGLATEVSDSTTNILLESAQFEPAEIRRTSRTLGLASDSSYRFERGIDPVQIEWASRRAARLIQEVAGGTICEGVLDVWAEPYKPRTIQLRTSRLNAVLGTDIKTDEARTILERLGFEPTFSSDPDEMTFAVPPFRATDTYREIDLIEEVIRIHGYDKIPENATLPITVGSLDKTDHVLNIARSSLVGIGYNEILTNSFCNESSIRLVSPWTQAEALVVLNAVRRDENRLRVSLLPGMLAVKRTNFAHGVAKSPLFEISRVFLPRPARAAGEEPCRDDVLPVEQETLSILSDDDLLTLKGAIEQVIETVGVCGTVEFVSSENPLFAEGLSGKILLNGQLLGIMGQTCADVTHAYDLPKPVYVAELNFDLIVKSAVLEHAYTPLPAYPAAVRDIAAIVDESLTWAAMEQCVRELNLPMLERISFFDVFRGKPVPKGKKSMAFSLTFRAPDRTLTSEEVEEARQMCIKALAGIGAELRE